MQLQHHQTTHLCGRSHATHAVHLPRRTLLGGTAKVCTVFYKHISQYPNNNTQHPKVIYKHATKHRAIPLAPIHASSTTTPTQTTPQDFRLKPRNKQRVAVFGATGYIGKYVARELIARGYDVVVFARSSSGIGGNASEQDTRDAFKDADVRFGDVTDVQSLTNTVFNTPVDVVISCLASRTGGKKDSWLIDYQATSNVLQAARAAGAQHFVLLSAICVQKPELEFQRAKLKFEEELMNAGDITYSIVRPTAFFKSLAGQVELVKDGKPFVMFGDGELASCKPISEADLASFMADCIEEKSKINQVLPIGGMVVVVGGW